MTIYDFNRLTHHDKVMFAWNECLFLMHHSEDSHHTASLFYRPAGRFREEYFIELWFNASETGLIPLFPSAPPIVWSITFQPFSWRICNAITSGCRRYFFHSSERIRPAARLAFIH
jgi:hypothetical protein